MYGDKIRLCYTDTDSFIMHVKTDDFYKDINNDVDKWFDTSNYDENDNRPLEIGKNKKVLGKFKDELGGRIMTKFVALRAKTYSFLIDEYTDEDYEKNRIVNKKAKGTKKCVVKREILLNIYLDSLFKYKKEFNNLKDDVLKLIGTSSICDVERKVREKDNNNNNNNKDSGAKRKVSKKDNSKNVNKDKDKEDNLIDKLLNNNKDKLNNFSDKVLNNLTNIAKLKEKNIN